MRPLLVLGLAVLLSGSALAQNVIVYDPGSMLNNSLQAATDLGLTVTHATNESALFDAWFDGTAWDLLVFEVPGNVGDDLGITIQDYVQNGGRVLFSWSNLDSLSSPADFLLTTFEIATATSYDTPLDIYSWDPSHEIWTTPNLVSSPISWSFDSWNDDGDRLTVMSSALPVGGFVATTTPNEAAIAIGSTGATICNGFLADSYLGAEIVPLLQNEMAYILGSVPPPPTDPDFVRGDANVDGGFDISDMVYTLSFIFVPGSEEPSCLKSADMNDDGTVDISDPIFGLATLFTPGAAPIPAPSVMCGADPSSDALTCGSFDICP